MSINIVEEFISRCDVKCKQKLNEYVDFCLHNNKHNHVKFSTERHHVLPKSIFPEYRNMYENKWNIVILTYEDHYIAHSILIDAINDSGMIYAWHAFNAYNQNNISLDLIGKEKYSELKELHTRTLSKDMSGDKHWARKLNGKAHPNTGRKHSEEAKQKMSEKQLGSLNHIYGKHLSDDVKEKLSIANIGENNAMYGKKHSDEKRAEISIKTKEAMKNLPIVECPHCGKTAKKSGAMTQHHFDKCKHKNNNNEI